MSSQASNAGRDEAKVRQKLVETGAVDVMIDIRGNFFYTRTVPCQLWFFDRSKERDSELAERVLMLDVRKIYRKVSRNVFDFSPEQQKNIAAIVWLHRKQSSRFIKLVQSYLAQAITEGQVANERTKIFEKLLDKFHYLVKPFATKKRDFEPLAETWEEFAKGLVTLSVEIKVLVADVAEQTAIWNRDEKDGVRDNSDLHAARKTLNGVAERCWGLSKKIERVVRLTKYTVNIAVKKLNARKSDIWPNSNINETYKEIENRQIETVEVLQRVQYFVQQANWLQERFPEAELCDVEGLVKLVDRSDIETNEWTLTPGRYVGVASEKVDENFNFTEALQSIHIDLKELNEEAVELATQISRNFEKMLL